MFWYLLNIFLTIIAWIWPIEAGSTWGKDYKRKYSNINTRAKRTCIVATVNWIILSGCRAITVGADTYAYKYYRFDVTATRSWESIFTDFILKYKMGEDIKDPGYPLLEKLFQIVSTNYQLWLLFIAIIFTIPMSMWIYKYSRNACISYILYSSLFYTFFAITGHRQTIATALVVWLGGKLIKERKLIPFLLVVAISMTIHTSAICFLPFYWISQIKINKLTLGLYWSAILFAFLFRTQFLVLLQSLVGYEDYQQIETARAGSFLYLLLAVALIVTLFFKQLSRRSDNPILNMSFNALFIATVFSPLLLINSACMRIIQYYSIFLLFLLPELELILAKGQSRTIFRVGVSVVMICLLVLNNPTYSFFFMQ